MQHGASHPEMELKSTCLTCVGVRYQNLLPAQASKSSLGVDV